MIFKLKKYFEFLHYFQNFEHFINITCQFNDINFQHIIAYMIGSSINSSDISQE